LRSFQQQERMLDAAFSPDGSKIVGVGSGGRIMMFSAAQSDNATGFPKEAGAVLNIFLSKDGRVALSCAVEDRSIALWDVATKRLLRRMRSDSVVWSVSLAPVRPLAASSHADGTVRLWDLHAGTLIRTLAGHTDIATSVVFAPDGRTLLSSSSDKTVKLWDVESGELLRTLSRHGGKVRGVAFSPDGSIAASASFDNHIILWEVATGKPLRTLSGHGHWVHCVSFSPDGRRLVSAGWDSTWAMWDVATGKMLRKVPGHTHVVVTAAFSANGQQVLTGSFDGTMRVWDAERREELRSFSREEGAVRSVVSLPDGTGALWASNSTMRRWDSDQAKRYRDFEQRLPAAQAALTANPDDPKALATYGEWYAFRGVHDWAAEFLEHSRSKGGDVSSLELARSYWQSENLPAAGREFRRARERGEANAEYVDLCLQAVMAADSKK